MNLVCGKYSYTIQSILDCNANFDCFFDCKIIYLWYVKDKIGENI